MQSHRNNKEPVYPNNTPLINSGFDRYEAQNELKTILHNAEIATFYHNALALEAWEPRTMKFTDSLRQQQSSVSRINTKYNRDYNQDPNLKLQGNFMANKSNNNYFITALGLIVVAGIGYYILTAPDNRTAGDKIGDAINELPNGVDKAARQLEDRTPAEKLGDAAEDAGDDLKKATNQQQENL